MQILSISAGKVGMHLSMTHEDALELAQLMIKSRKADMKQAGERLLAQIEQSKARTPREKKERA